MLRNKNINYKRGTFFVTIQAAFNKTIFGAIVGDKCVLNELGLAVETSLKSLGERYPGVIIDEFVVMPNHVHFLIKIGVAGLSAREERAGTEPRHLDLGAVVGRFKSWISKVYRDMLADGKAVDVGSTPWQRDYWDKFVTTGEQFDAYRRYIRENPAKWTRDRFGTVTSYTYGNVGLLNSQLIGFVASQGAFASELKPKKLWTRAGAETAGAEARHPHQIGVAGFSTRDEKAGLGASGKPPILSCFTSAQERAVFAKVMMQGRRFVKIYPGGIPEEPALDPAVVSACNEGRGLLIAPVPSGTGINKQRAVWCNEYILKNAVEVWAGEITPGHTLASLVTALQPKK